MNLDEESYVVRLKFVVMPKLYHIARYKSLISLLHGGGNRGELSIYHYAFDCVRHIADRREDKCGTRFPEKKAMAKLLVEKTGGKIRRVKTTKLVAGTGARVRRKVVAEVTGKKRRM